MGFKHTQLDHAAIKALMEATNFLLKVIAHVEFTPRIRELDQVHLPGIEIKGAWGGPGALQLYAHALAPVAQLPVLEILSAVHILADLTLPYGRVVHDYLVPTK